MRIEAATAADGPEIIRLLEATPGSARWTPAHIASLFSTQGALQRMVLLCTHDGHPAGFVVLLLLAGTDSMEAEIENIAVLPACQRRGVGQALLKAASVWAAAHGVALLRLEVRQSNLPAQHLYEKCGWRRTGLRRGYYTLPVEDAVLMERSIDTGTGIV